VKARYLQRGVQLYDSAAHGAIEIQLTAAGMHVYAYRERVKRYWFSQ
jgi:beta-lactamase superfamily II metal-dependent hydrolase